MRLDVPFVRQDKDSVDCGPACASMIMSYYGQNLSIEQIKNEIKVYGYGTFTPELGIFFLNKGFDVIITTFNPDLFNLKDCSMTQEEIYKRFQAKLESEKDKNNAIALRYFLEFMDKGGNIEVKIPDENDIESEIAQKRPLICVLTANFFEGDKPKLDSHFNMVTGLEDEKVFVNDPHWANLGGKKERKMQEFLFGIYANAAGGYDNCALIKIIKKSK